MSHIMRKQDFCLCKNKSADQHSNCTVTAQLISACVFAIQIVQSHFLVNPKFQGSILLQWLYRPVCVRLCRKSRRPVFSRHGSKIIFVLYLNSTVSRYTLIMLSIFSSMFNNCTDIVIIFINDNIHMIMNTYATKHTDKHIGRESSKTRKEKKQNKGTIYPTSLTP